MLKHDLAIDPPRMNSAGSLGFSPDLHGPIEWSHLGAFVTNPVSLTPRTPAHGQRFIEFPGGFLLHTGYPNPGINQLIKHYARHWRRAPIPVFVHLLARNPEEVAEMIRRLEALEGVMGVEVGVDSGASVDKVTGLTQSAYGELPVIMRLPMERAVEMAPAAIDAGAATISLAPPRGAYPGEDGEVVGGRLYGPGILPFALRKIQELAQLGIPVIGAGGLYTQQHEKAMLAAGALAVQLDGVFWRGGYHWTE